MPFISKGGGGDAAKGTITTDQIKTAVDSIGTKVDNISFASVTNAIAALKTEIKAVQQQIATPGAPPATTCVLLGGPILGMTTTDPNA